MTYCAIRTTTQAFSGFVFVCLRQQPLADTVLKIKGFQDSLMPKHSGKGDKIVEIKW